MSEDELREFKPDDTVRERREILVRFENWLETPMLVLGLLWLVLLVLDLTRGLSPFLEALSTAIWIAFIFDFLIKITLAPEKIDYLRDNWLGVLALGLPALRVFRIFRALKFLRLARATRGLRLFRIFATLNRGMKSLGAAMGRRGIGYVGALTVIIVFAGAAGMHAFERDVPGGLSDFGAALWWTSMLITTMGSEYWPQTGEGRFLCFSLALYSFAVFGYVTATLASFFVDQDREREKEISSGESVYAANEPSTAPLAISTLTAERLDRLLELLEAQKEKPREK